MAKPKVIAGELFEQYAGRSEPVATKLEMKLLKRGKSITPYISAREAPYAHRRGVMALYIVPATIDGRRAFLLGRATGYKDFEGVVLFHDKFEVKDDIYWSNAHKLSPNEVARLSSLMPAGRDYQKIEEFGGIRRSLHRPEFNHIRAVVMMKTRDLPAPWGDELSDEEMLHFTGGVQRGMAG